MNYLDRQEYIDAHTSIHSLNYVEVEYYVNLFRLYLPDKYKFKFQTYMKYRFRHKDKYVWLRESTYKCVLYFEKLAYKNMYKLNLESKSEYFYYFCILLNENVHYLTLFMTYFNLKEYLSWGEYKNIVHFYHQISLLSDEYFGISLIKVDITNYMIQFQSDKSRRIIEKYYRKEIINNFDKFFPKYKFIKQEVNVKNVGKIDILAKDKESNRVVIIEIKTNKQNPNKQLLAYATGYDNPILVGITNMDKKYYLDNIIYYPVSYIDNLIE
jgi:hypothetical protein|nr:MAG TPA: hydrolase [Bacteriophage sp.]